MLSLFCKIPRLRILLIYNNTISILSFSRARIYNVYPSVPAHTSFQKYVLQHSEESTWYKLVSKNLWKNDRYIWIEWIYALLLHPLSKRRKALQLTFWQKRRKNSDVFLSFCLNSNQECGGRKEIWKKLSKIFGGYVIKFLPLHPLSERTAIDDWLAD